MWGGGSALCSACRVGSCTVAASHCLGLGQHMPSLSNVDGFNGCTTHLTTPFQLQHPPHHSIPVAAPTSPQAGRRRQVQAGKQQAQAGRFRLRQIGPTQGPVQAGSGRQHQAQAGPRHWVVQAPAVLSQAGRWAGRQAGRQVAPPTSPPPRSFRLRCATHHHPTATPQAGPGRPGRPRQTGSGWTRQAQAGASKQAQADTGRHRQTGSGRLRPGFGLGRHRQPQACTQPRQAQGEETIQAKSFKKKALDDEASKQVQADRPAQTPESVAILAKSDLQAVRSHFKPSQQRHGATTAARPEGPAKPDACFFLSHSLIVNCHCTTEARWHGGLQKSMLGFFICK